MEIIYEEPDDLDASSKKAEDLKKCLHVGGFLRHMPGGETLRKKSIKKNGSTRYVNKQACIRCPYRGRCVNGKEITKWSELDFGKDSLEKKEKW